MEQMISWPHPIPRSCWHCIVVEGGENLSLPKMWLMAGILRSTAWPHMQVNTGSSSSEPGKVHMPHDALGQPCCRNGQVLKETLSHCQSSHGPNSVVFFCVVVFSQKDLRQVSENSSFLGIPVFLLQQLQSEISCAVGKKK